MDDFKILLNVTETELNSYKWRNFETRRSEIKSIFLHDGDQIKDPERLMYFKKPPEPTLHPLDLNEGFENYTFNKGDFYLGKLSDMEKHNVKNNILNLKRGSEGKCKIHSRRSILDYIMLIPYSRNINFNEDISILITKFDDVLYIVKKNNTVSDGTTKNDTYYFKFKQCCFSDSPGTEPNTKIPIDENRFNFCTYRFRLENFEFLIFDITPGIISNTEIKDLTNLEDINKCHFVVTKMIKEKGQRNLRNWHNNPKAGRWWPQAYLLNVRDIYVGFKDEEGFVRQPIEHICTNNMVKRKNWKRKIYLGFLNKFLTTVSEKMSDVNCPYTVYEFCHLKSDESIKYKIHEGKSELSLLTEEFIKECSTAED